MLRKKVEIDGREVEFKASAAVPRIYRMKFRRDEQARSIGMVRDTI